jgi:hypothetical protein
VAAVGVEEVAPVLRGGFDALVVGVKENGTKEVVKAADEGLIRQMS